MIDIDSRGWQIFCVRWFGLDIGSKTIGIAVSDDQGMVATPVKTLKRKKLQLDMEALSNLVKEYNVERFVIGLPRNLEGRETEASRRARFWGKQIVSQLGRPVHFWDERYSTVAAERVLLEADLSRKRRKEVINHVAATLILQGFLDSRGDQGKAR
jgi:putative Holliday junction resolvase